MELFFEEFPPTVPVGFTIMRFGTTREHSEILETLQQISSETGVPLVRADHRMYHDDRLENVRVYLHGCAFGIAFFEDAEVNGFNPNVALEVGYLHALEKPVLHLKSSSLEAMPTDLLGKLYLPYDENRIDRNTRSFISDWVSRRYCVGKTDDSQTTSVETVRQLLKELYPSLPLEDGPEHLPRHVAGLLQYRYLTVGAVRSLLEQTEAARAWVNSNRLPEFSTCAISHAIALRHSDYTDEPFWKGTTAVRLKKGQNLFNL